MKKLVAAVVAVLATAAIAIAGATAAGGPLFHVEGVECGVIDRDGSGVLTTDSSLTWFASGKVELRCEADGTPGATVVQFTGFLCGLGPFGVTTQSKNVVRREGRIQLTCQGYQNPNNSVDTASSSGYGAG